MTMAPRIAQSRLTGSWTVLVGAWAVSLVGLAFWLWTTPDGLLREQLKVYQFWSLEACVALGAILLAASWRDLLRGMSPASLAQMMALALLAVALTLFVAPRTNRIYYDEQIYQGIGQNLAELRLAQMCNDGTVEYHATINHEFGHMVGLADPVTRNGTDCDSGTSVMHQFGYYGCTIVVEYPKTADFNSVTSIANNWPPETVSIH